MTPGVTSGILMVAGAALVVQNLLMAKITGTASSVLTALLLNSAVGLVLLIALLLRTTGLGGLADIAGAFRPWFILPGVLGTFFVFANITGYRTLGAAPTVALLVASQLICGLIWDLVRAEHVTLKGASTAAVGAVLLICGVLIILSRKP
jgi:transporter family-2 protein